MAFNILGFKISHKGITLPFSNKCISILSLIVLATQAVTSTRAAGFPDGGTFKQQDDFINSLPKACPQDTSIAVTDLVSAQNPFAHMSTMSPDLRVKVIRHEFDQTYGMVMRRMATSERSLPGIDRHIREQEQVFIGGEGDGSSPLTYIFERTPEGNLKPIKKEAVSVKAYADGIEDAKRHEGLVVSIETDHTRCYSSRRPGS